MYPAENCDFFWLQYNHGKLIDCTEPAPVSGPSDIYTRSIEPLLPLSIIEPERRQQNSHHQDHSFSIIDRANIASNEHELPSQAALER